MLFSPAYGLPPVPTSEPERIPGLGRDPFSGPDITPHSQTRSPSGNVLLPPDEFACKLAPVAVIDMPHLRQDHLLEWLRRHDGEMQGKDIQSVGGEIDKMDPTFTTVSSGLPLRPGQSQSRNSTQAPSHMALTRTPKSGSGAERPAPKISVTFVNIQRPTGKRDWAAESQIRSHAMRQVHLSRRAAKERARWFAVNLTTPEGSLDTQNEAQGAGHRSYSARIAQSSWMTHHPGDAPHSEGLAANNGPCFNSITNASRAFLHDRPPRNGYNAVAGFIPFHTQSQECVFYYEGCGKLHIHCQHLTEGVRALQFITVSPPIGSGRLDPFDQSAIPITHRMHELFYHCKL
jgi:hypothetical protein